MLFRGFEQPRVVDIERLPHVSDQAVVPDVSGFGRQVPIRVTKKQELRPSERLLIGPWLFQGAAVCNRRFSGSAIREFAVPWLAATRLLALVQFCEQLFLEVSSR